MLKITPLEIAQQNSYLSGSNASYIEALYEEYLKNPQNVDANWQTYFQSLNQNQKSAACAWEKREISHQEIQEQFKRLAQKPSRPLVTAKVPANIKQEKVDDLITSFRTLGHLAANIDPLHKTATLDSRLTLEYYNFTEADLNKSFATGNTMPNSEASLSEIYTNLKKLYCGDLGFEFAYILDEVEHEWVRSYIEHRIPELKLNAEVKIQILKKLIAADGLEKHLDTKYKGQKRFSGEGADSLIPMLDMLAKHACAAQVRELVMCMAHRARLNVLINIMGQSPKELFKAFEGTKDYGLTTGDVKYHLGFANDIQTSRGPIHLSLAFNPSHLEFINPVVMGSVRARQDREPKDTQKDYALAVVIHGDAAFSGQGIVMETLSMSKTRAYDIGGTIHIVINNQVGFTTSDSNDLRSSRYCSDLGKMIEAPIIHVNGDDPEAAAKAIIFALDYRMTFHKDIIIDLVCYRRHGHQEVDEPRATQPLMYQLIDSHPTPRELYGKNLIEEGIVSQEEINRWVDDYRSRLDEGGRMVETLAKEQINRYVVNWATYLNQSWRSEVDTSLPKDRLINLGKKLTHLPKDFTLQRNVQMIFDARKKMTEGALPLDWGFAENLAYASLLVEGHPVRLSGEDCRRGTFFHRQAAVFDQKTGKSYMPIAHLDPSQAAVYIYDSLLSEAGTLGFECGYAAADPNSLVLWEAQYGDFANGAQVIIDQFLSSGYQKWNRLCGLIMLLPHGHEGAGPEHTSARLERYLQLCAQENMQVFVPTTPAQIFHLLRRQILRPLRTPLIVMTPKSLLRHKLAVSTFEDLAHGQLQLVIKEVDNLNPSKVKKLILCSGKIYYELLEKRRESNLDHIAIVRIEQLYPFPYDELKAAVKMYSNLEEVIWCQEEPRNQGAWFNTAHRIQKCLPENKIITYVGRSAMAAPAAGYPALHLKEQMAVIREALGV